MAKYLRLIKWQFLLFLLIFLFHIGYIPNGFVWLDHGDIEKQRAIIPLSQLLNAFISRFGETGFYRPVVTILLSSEYVLFNTWAPGYHFVNILLHLVVVVVSVYFSKSFFNLSEKAAWLVGLIVGIHPMSWFTVGTIASLPDILATLFSLSAILCYIKMKEGKKTDAKKTAIFLLVSFLAFLSKETALVLVPGLLLIWFVTTKHKKLPSLIQRAQQIRFVIPNLFRDLYIFRVKPGMTLAVLLLVILYVVYFIFRFVAVPEIWKVPFQPLSFSLAVGTRFSAVARTIYALISPFPPRISDATKVVGVFDWNVLLVIGLIVLSAWILWRKGIRSTETKLILFMFLVLAPGLNVIPLPRFWTTNYGYFATIGIGVSFALLWTWCSKQRSLMAKSVQAGSVFWIIIASVSTFQAGHKLSDDKTLFEPEVRIDPYFKEGAYYLGNYFWQNGSLDEAKRYYNQSLEKDPTVIAYLDHVSARINLAGVLAAQDKSDEAQQILRDVVSHSSGENERLARYNLASIVQQKGDYQQVIELLDGHITNWNQQDAWLLLLKAYTSLGKEKEAKETLKNAWPFLDNNLKQELRLLVPN